MARKVAEPDPSWMSSSRPDLILSGLLNERIERFSSVFHLISFCCRCRSRVNRSGSCDSFGWVGTAVASGNCSNHGGCTVTRARLRISEPQVLRPQDRKLANANLSCPFGGFLYRLSELSLSSVLWSTRRDGRTQRFCLHTRCNFALWCKLPLSRGSADCGCGVRRRPIVDTAGLIRIAAGFIDLLGGSIRGVSQHFRCIRRFPASAVCLTSPQESVSHLLRCHLACCSNASAFPSLTNHASCCGFNRATAVIPYKENGANGGLEA